ncbi:MAG: outer membrane protein assembly factor BamD [Ignavibacteria bacterium]|nr:outer membrane protein assembly factor BamD [Ignavibacteria bacterium]
MNQSVINFLKTILNTNQGTFYVLLVAMFGCSSQELIKQRTAEECFQKGKELLLEENYLEAIEEFKIVGLQYSGSEYADDAQYYLGECYYEREEFLLAAFEYDMLKKRMASSTYVPMAQFQLAQSYYRLSPRSTLDQRYTNKAIDEFQTFLEYYPQHDSAGSASEKIKRLNGRLAKKEFDIAVLYMTLEEYLSAQHYFENILERFHDTEFAEQAQLGIAQSFVSRKKLEKAKEALSVFFLKYPESKWKEQAQQLKRSIETELKEQPAHIPEKRTESDY